MKYLVDLAGRRREVVIEGDQLWVDGMEHRVELRGFEASTRGVIVIDGVKLPLVVESLARSRWMIYAEGERWEAEVIDERTDRARRTAAQGVAHSTPPLLKAPMPGLVVRILVEPGQTVAEGASLVVLEAMKMENELKAAGPGAVEQILVSAGQTVERGQALIRFRSRDPSRA